LYFALRLFLLSFPFASG
jgi:hypothetical protein